MNYTFSLGVNVIRNFHVVSIHVQLLNELYKAYAIVLKEVSLILAHNIVQYKPFPPAEKSLLGVL